MFLPGAGSAHHYFVAALILTELVSWDCLSRLPQTGWLKAIAIYPLIVLEARSPKSKCQQVSAPSEGSGGDPSCLFQLLVASGVPWLVAMSPQSLRLSSHSLPSWYLSVSSPHLLKTPGHWI